MATQKAAVFVDLPNFYSRLLKSGIEEPRVLRDYFLYWLDFDVLARSLAESFSGIWAFYSGGRIGPSSERIEGKYLDQYISRINALVGLTARDVNIPGEQREPVPYKCQKCGDEGMSEAVSEKGIDASLTVHMFDTMESWDTAFLLSGDADFVPTVASLRRRGKIVIGVGFPDASSALVRECYSYIDIGEAFLQQDLLLYFTFRKDGVAQAWLTQEVNKGSLLLGPHPSVSVICGPETRVLNGVNTGRPVSYRVILGFDGSPGLSSEDQTMMELQRKFAGRVRVSKTGKRIEKYVLTGIKPSNWEAAKRKLGTFVSGIQVIKGVQVQSIDDDTVVCSMKYALDNTTQKYNVVEP